MNSIENAHIWQANYRGDDGRPHTFYATAESWEASLAMALEYTADIHVILTRLEILPDASSGTVRPAIILIDKASL